MAEKRQADGPKSPDADDVFESPVDDAPESPAAGKRPRQGADDLPAFPVDDAPESPAAGKRPRQGADDVPESPAAGKRPRREAPPHLMVGSPAKVIESGRLGEVMEHTPEDKSMTFKVKFNDGAMPDRDWFAEEDVQVRPPVEVMVERAAEMRRKALVQMETLKKDILKNFNDYTTRLELLTAGKAAVSAGKLVASFIPGLGAAAEAAHGASVAAEITHLIAECTELATSLAGLVDTYTFHTVAVHEHHDTFMGQLRAKEGKLLKVLSRHTYIVGENKVLGTEATEPGARVLADMIEVRAISERLSTLDELGLWAEDASQRSPDKKPESAPESAAESTPK